MDHWIEAVCRELGLPAELAAEVEVEAILEVAKHAAHQVMRPAAPVSTYLMGLAVAQGADPTQVADRIARLAQGWSSPG